MSDPTKAFFKKLAMVFFKKLANEDVWKNTMVRVMEFAITSIFNFLLMSFMISVSEIKS